jgi:hypothetical protein
MSAEIETRRGIGSLANRSMFHLAEASPLFRHRAPIIRQWFLDGIITANYCEMLLEDMWLDLEKGSKRTEDDLIRQSD